MATLIQSTPSTKVALKDSTNWRVGVSGDRTPIFQTKRQFPPASEKPVLIGVRGKWYDVTNFAASHPGGDVILEYAGRDATAVFVAYHHDKVLQRWKAAGTYDFDADAPGGDAFAGAHIKLAADFEAKGYFVTSARYAASKLTMTLAFLVIALVCVAQFRVAYAAGDEPAKRLSFSAGAVLLAGFWQQSGFLMHDLMHNQLFHHRKLDQALGWLFGCVCFGVSSKWWR